MKDPATVYDRWLKIRCVPGATYFSADARWSEERRFTELQGVTMEVK